MILCIWLHYESNGHHNIILSYNKFGSISAHIHKINCLPYTEASWHISASFVDVLHGRLRPL